MPRALLFAVVLGLVSPGAIAQDTPDNLLSALNSPHYGVRELALQRMVSGQTPLNLQAIEEMMLREDLSFEQRARLERVGLEFFRVLPRAGLGVQFNLNHVGPGAAIARAIEPFDAHNWLQPGDVILSVQGQQIRTADDLRFQIISRTPGEAMPMTINRQGELLEVAPKLGSYNALGAAQPLTTSDLLWGWMLRMQRNGLRMDQDKTILVQAPPDALWASDIAPPARLTIGGTVRDAGNYRGVRVNQRVPEIQIEIRGGAVQELDPRAMQIQLLKTRIEQLDSQIRLRQAQLDQMPEALRELTEREIVQLQMQLDQWQAVLQQLAEP